MTELDELLSLLDEDGSEESKKVNKSVEKENKTENIKSKKVYGGCKILVDPEKRLIGYDELRIRLKRWTKIGINILPKCLNSDAVKQGKYVICGVLSQKIIRKSSKGNKFLLLTLTDLHLSSIACFIFKSELIKKFYKITLGTVLVIAHGKILDSKDKMSNNIAMSINNDDQVLNIGKSPDFGYCKKVINGNNCNNVININRTDLCVKHLKEGYNKYMSRRNDTNRSQMRSLRTNKNYKSVSGNNDVYINNNITYSLQKPKQIKNNKKQVYNTERVIRKIHKRNNMPYMHSRGYKQFNTMVIVDEKNKISKLLKNKEHMVPKLGRNLNDNTGDLVIKFDKNDNNNSNDKNNIPSTEPLKRKRPNNIKITDHISRKRHFDDVFKRENESKRKEQLINEAKRRKIDTNDDNTSEVSDDEICKKSPKKMVVKVFKCYHTKCSMKGKSVEKVNSFCKEHMRDIQQSNGTKYFWKCKCCEHVITVINKRKKPHTQSCLKCGKTCWIPVVVSNIDLI